MTETMIQEMVDAEMARELETRRPLFRRFRQAIEAEIRCNLDGHPGYGSHGCIRCYAARPRTYEPTEPVVILADPAPRSDHRPASDPADCEIEFPGARCSCWN